MCELLGMSANVPTDICFSFSGLMQRGGATGPHKDGWGIVFYNGKGYREFRDDKPSSSSQVAELVKQYPIKSDIVISHIRQANSGRIALENTHPFRRELWGRHWSFAHNGQIKSVKKRQLGSYQCVGSTDSEYAFCWMLEQIRTRFPEPPRRENALFRLVFDLCRELNGLGIFNILMTDSKYLFSFCSSKLAWITRKAPFGEASLTDTELTVDFMKETTPKDVVTVISTRPLTDNEQWNEMEKGELTVFKHGKVITRFT